MNAIAINRRSSGSSIEWTHGLKWINICWTDSNDSQTIRALNEWTFIRCEFQFWFRSTKIVEKKLCTELSVNDMTYAFIYILFAKLEFISKKFCEPFIANVYYWSSVEPKESVLIMPNMNVNHTIRANTRPLLMCSTQTLDYAFDYAFDTTSAFRAHCTRVRRKPIPVNDSYSWNSCGSLRQKKGFQCFRIANSDKIYFKESFDRILLKKIGYTENIAYKWRSTVFAALSWLKSWDIFLLEVIWVIKTIQNSFV